MRRFVVLLLMVVLLSVPVAAFAQTEPYSSSSTNAEDCRSEILVGASGLSVNFSVSCVAECTWDFGDGQTGAGNPFDHTYVADGDYTVTATCGDVVITRELHFEAGLSFTGLGLVPFGIAIAALVLLGGGALWFSRRARAKS